MGTSVNRIPSANMPFVDKQGRINSVWYEFFRNFISRTVESSSGTGSNATVDIEAGAGLREAVEGTFSVGQGSGLVVNADDVSIDINGLTRVQGVLDDEIIISRPQSNNSLNKTRLRDVAGLSSPGGSNTQVQFNNAGSFEGDTGLTYTGVGVSGTLGIAETLTINGTTFSSATNANKFIFQVPTGSATTHFTFQQSGAGSSDMPVDLKSHGASPYMNIINNSGGTGTTTSTSAVYFSSGSGPTTYWSLGLTSSSTGRTFTLGSTALNAGNVFTADGTNFNFQVNNSLLLSTAAGLTASTTQTQGQGALTKDVNEVATVANANDVRTLPAALAGRSCLVINNGANTLQVFPASGDNLGAGLNTSTTIVAGSRKMFVAFDSTNWEPVI